VGREVLRATLPAFALADDSELKELGQVARRVLSRMREKRDNEKGPAMVTLPRGTWAGGDVAIDPADAAQVVHPAALLDAAAPPVARVHCGTQTGTSTAEQAVSEQQPLTYWQTVPEGQSPAPAPPASGEHACLHAH
jgi:hypothetical protein